ncbi:MAG: PQQ-dependent sugar dehydrogenase [Acidimicrobiia bacterium]
MSRPLLRDGISILLALFLVACDGGAGDPSTTATAPAVTQPPSTTTSIVPGTTTTVPETTTTTLSPLSSLAYEQVAALDFPVQLIPVLDTALSLIATRDGRIWVFDGETVADNPVLDISGRVRSGGERGLLSIVLHPEDPARLFAHYSDGNGDTVVSEFTMVSETEADPDSERVLLSLDQPASNHNGGMIHFLPDGRLLLGLGDGGGAGDRFGNAQNRETLLGGLVALSVDGDPAPVLYSYGLRNPWRFWIDGETLYVADVGQNAYEEVTVTPLMPNVNYGWPITEGLHCFRPEEGCDTNGLTLPLVEVAHDDAGTCSITGGVVYRGTAIPEISGHYFYSDYCGGYLRSFRHQDGETVDQTDWTGQVGDAGRVTGFGVDPAGEMYLTTTTAVLRVVPVRG